MAALSIFSSDLLGNCLTDDEIYDIIPGEWGVRLLEHIEDELLIEHVEDELLIGGQTWQTKLRHRSES